MNTASIFAGVAVAILTSALIAGLTMCASVELYAGGAADIEPSYAAACFFTIF